jgi:hypothetical protein
MTRGSVGSMARLKSLSPETTPPNRVHVAPLSLLL